jgi:hypothetical protein
VQWEFHEPAGLSPDLIKVKITLNFVFAFLDCESEIDPLAKTGKTLEVVHVVVLSPSSLSSDVS